jgi:two-component system, OmpR family, response regulator
VTAASAPILIVEDDEDVRTLLQERMSAAGYPVIGAGSGEEAVTIARRQTPRLVILDLLLPGMDGWQALREIRAVAQGVRVPVIVVSIVDQSAQADRVEGYIVKPFRLGQIVGKVAELIGPPDREVMT